MNFLNGLLAFGALAFLIPLAIHLLFRQQLVTVEWGAMHLLREVLQRQRRRFQLSQLLLLLLRCAIPILLAFALARPVLTGFQSLPGSAPESLIIVVDDSRSMGVLSEAGTSRMQQLKAVLRDYLSTRIRQDEVTLMRTSQLEVIPSAVSPVAAIAELRPLSAVGNGAEMGAILDAALEAAEGASHAQRRVIIASDFQAKDVTESTIASLERLRQRWEAMNFQPSFFLLDVGAALTPEANVSVDAVEIDAPVAITDRSFAVASQLRNAGDLAASDVRVDWYLGSELVDSMDVALPARGSTVVRTQLRIASPGVHEIRCEVDLPDALPEDNVRRLAVEVIDQVELLLVQVAARQTPRPNRTDFLSLALSPFSFVATERTDAVRVKRAAPAAVAGEIASNDFDLVVLDGVASVPATAQGALADFVNQGGGMIIFDGDRVTPSAYNSVWASDRSALTLPARLGTTIGGIREDGAEPLHPAPFNPQFRPWALLGEAGEEVLDQVEVFAYRKLTLSNSESRNPQQQATEDIAETDNEQSSATARANVLWSLASGDPLVVAKRYGRGQVIQFAISADAEWTTLPLRPLFVPMMQQLASYLAGTGAELNVSVSEPVFVPISELRRQEQPTDDLHYTVSIPGDEEMTMLPTAEAESGLAFSQTVRPGVYRFRSFTRQSNLKGPSTTSTLRIAEVDAAESRLRKTSDERLKLIAESVNAGIHESIAGIRDQEQRERFGREIWQWLVVALVGTMIAELVVQQRLSRGSAGARAG